MVVARRGGADDGVDREGVCARTLQQLLDGLACHVTGTEAFLVEDAAFFDANAGHNPLVGGVDHPAQFLIIQDIVGHVAAYTCDNSM